MDIHDMLTKVGNAYMPPRSPAIPDVIPAAKPLCPTADQVAAIGLKLDMVLAELSQIRRSLDASRTGPGAGTSSQA